MSGVEYIPFTVDRSILAGQPPAAPEDDERFVRPLQEAKFQRFRDERQHEPAETLATLAALAAPQASEPAFPWSEGLLRLAALPTPADVTVAAWDRIVYIATRLSEQWGGKAQELGWTTLDLYGCWQNPRAGRLDADGLATCLIRWQASPLVVVDIEPTLAVLRTEDRRSVLRYRRYPLTQPVPLWIAYDEGRPP